MVLDLNNPVSLLRLRCGDTRDIPVLSDDVYQNALDSNNGNLKAAAVLCAQYILATLAFDSQQSLGIVTVWGNQVFSQYKQYLLLVIKDPDFNQVSPIPYVGDNGTKHTPLEFKKHWDCENSYWRRINTESQWEYE